MAFITNCKRTSCNVFLFASLVVSLMMVAPLQALPAPYAGCSDDIAVPSDPRTQEQIEQVLGGMEILIELGSRLNGTILNISDLQNVDLSLRMVCNMYNLYTHFTTLHTFSTALPQSEPRIDYTSRQFVAWRVMHSACNWATSVGNPLLTDCNFHSIASTCYSFNHRRMIHEDRLDVGCAAQRRVPISAQQWISRNELPQAVADYIINDM